MSKRNSTSADVTKGDGLFNNVITHFEAARSSDGKIDCILLADAAMTVVPVYDTIFGAGIVSSQLKKDLENSSSKTREAAQKMQEEEKLEHIYLEDLIVWEIKKKGLAFLRKDRNNGVKNLLWMKRALDFIMTFLENIMVTMKDSSSKECATQAYNIVLKPYHGMMVSTVVSMAFNMCPSRNDLVKRLGFESAAEVEQRVTILTTLFRPMLDEASTLLQKNECNFPDKI